MRTPRSKKKVIVSAIDPRVKMPTPPPVQRTEPPEPPVYDSQQDEEDEK